MNPLVRAIFPSFTDKFEGNDGWMYLDVLGYVTCGRGNKIDPIGDALKLPWMQWGTMRATQIEIATEWQKVKASTNLMKAGGGAFKAITTLRLLPADVDALTWDTLDVMELHVAAQFDGWGYLPADAQLGLLSMSWAAGSEVFPRFPKFSAAIRSRDFITAAHECKMRETGNPGLVPRDKANAQLFVNAAYTYAMRTGDTLLWPSLAPIPYATPIDSPDVPIDLTVDPDDEGG